MKMEKLLNNGCVHFVEKSSRKSGAGIFMKKIHRKICRHICSFCGKGFTTKHNLNEHMNRHADRLTIDKFDADDPNFSNESFFVCSKCGKQFMTNGGLNSHICDGSEGPYKCKETGCTLGFYSIYLLKRHA